MNQSVVAAVALSLTGCVALTPAGARVIDLSSQGSDVRGRCEYLGLVESGFKSNSFSDAQKQIRNDTAAIGGDVFLIVSQERSALGEPKLTAEAYRCGIDREPQPASGRASA